MHRGVRTDEGGEEMKTGRRDWTGNSQAAFVTFGAEGHATHERAEHDYYATEPRGGTPAGTGTICSDNLGACMWRGAHIECAAGAWV